MPYVSWSILCTLVYGLCTPWVETQYSWRVKAQNLMTWVSRNAGGSRNQASKVATRPESDTGSYRKSGKLTWRFQFPLRIIMAIQILLVRDFHMKWRKLWKKSIIYNPSSFKFPYSGKITQKEIKIVIFFFFIDEYCTATIEVYCTLKNWGAPGS